MASIAAEVHRSFTGKPASVEDYLLKFHAHGDRPPVRVKTVEERTSLSKAYWKGLVMGGKKCLP